MPDPTAFNSWPLHDAPVQEIKVEWGARCCVISLNVFLRQGERASPCQIRFDGVAEVHVPMRSSWGKSIAVNTHAQVGKTYRLEMQSGDMIQVVAERVELVSALT